MSKLLTHQLFQLIKSLTKAEKRNFRLFATRNGGDKEAKFLALFTALDAQVEYDEERLLKKLPGIKPGQLSNLKSHLYEQLLISLRLLKRKHIDIKLREMLDFATVLYEKGLYMQSLQQLGKARQQAQECHRQPLLLDIIEFEKLIESRHITRSPRERADELTAMALHTREAIGSESAWSDLALKLYGLYLRIGHVKNQEGYRKAHAFFHGQLPPTPASPSFFGRVYRAQCYVWYHYIIQDFPTCYRYAREWVSLFDRQPDMRLQEADLYMKGLHNLLSVLFFCVDSKRFALALGRLEVFIAQHEEQFNENTRIHAFLYLETARLNKFFLEGDFLAGVESVPGLEERLAEMGDLVDSHRILVFWYKIACMFFGYGNMPMAIQYLYRIINSNHPNLREDIQCFARILSLVAHYEAGNDDLIDSQIRSTYRFLLKMKDMELVQQEVLNFLKNSAYMNRQDLKQEFIALKERLDEVAKDPYQRRPFLYLDLNTWLQSKIEERSIRELVLEKMPRKQFP